MDKKHHDTLARRAALLAAPLLIILAIAWATRDCTVDDAYIGYEHVRNLIAGHGLQFDPAERVEGVTNVGWLLVLAALSPIGELPIVAKIAGLLSLLIATLWCFGFGARFFGSEPVGPLLALPIALFTATHFEAVYYAVCGMESGLLAAMLCLLVWLVSTGRITAAGIVSGLAFLVRPECVLLYPVWWALAMKWAPSDHRRGMLGGLVAWAMLIASATAARYAYYGDWVPNTFLAKPTTTGNLIIMVSRTLTGMNANLGAPFAGVLAIPVLILGVRALTKRFGAAGLMMGSVVLVGWLFSTYAVVDWTCSARYFAPYAPLGFVVFWVGLVEAARGVLAYAGAIARLKETLEALAVLLLVSNGLTLALHLSPNGMESYPGYVLNSRPLREPCLWMRENLPAEVTIGTRRIGAVGYLTERRVFDYCFGLNHRPVARLIHDKGKQFDDPHDPALAPLWAQYAPDYLLEDQDIMERIAADAGGSLERFEVHGMTYSQMKTFPLGPDASWVLCRRLEPREPASPARPESKST
ncbi:MAG: DUF2029 domain-containing protein [Armatimonadetes bacterium]|nr:DUF2029 domain-containing protein [Armatimonadota bacterium]